MKKSIELIKLKLQAGLAGKIKFFYIGDPILIPESAMPCIAISPESTSTNVVDNARDSHTHSITISVIIDARKYFNATPDKMVGTQYLMEIMSNMSSDGTIDPHSVMGILRDNLTLETNRFVDNISSIEYTTRRRTEDLITIEAIAHTKIQYIITR